MLRALLFMAAFAAGCSSGGQDFDASVDLTVDLTVDFADPEGSDLAADAKCTGTEDCDDRIECTQDLCGVDGSCRHVPKDELCPDDQKCSPLTGCTANQCSGDGECDDQVFCNGSERCYQERCWPGDAKNCDDGNPCTNDYCSTAADACVHETLPSCRPDASTDGDVAEAFDPLVHYSGRFTLAPVLSSDCGLATYRIDYVQFSRGSSQLTATTGPSGVFQMVQDPAPDGASFATAYQQAGCGSYQLSGTFENADEFIGRWTASFSGSCSMCSGQNFVVYGVRQ